MIVLETSRHVQDTPLGVWISREPFQIFNGFGYDKQPPPPRTSRAASSLLSSFKSSCPSVSAVVGYGDCQANETK